MGFQQRAVRVERQRRAPRLTSYPGTCIANATVQLRIPRAAHVIVNALWVICPRVLR